MAPRTARVLAVATVVIALQALVPPQHAFSSGEQTRPAIQKNLEVCVREMNLARDTGQPVHYERAQQALDRIRNLNPDNYEALRLQGWVHTGRHEFEEALVAAKQAAKERSFDSWNYGVMVDAYVELGLYPEAVKAAQKMVDLQPSAGAYSRISYLRWLHGDPEGAEEMLRLALDTVAMGSVEADWTRTQLGNLHFDRGKIADAEAEYQRVLEANPEYVHALAGVAKVQAARGRYRQAITGYRKALAGGEIAEYRIALGDVYAAAGDKAAANEQYRTVARWAKRRLDNPETRMQLAIFWSDHNMQTRQARKYAEADVRGADDIQAWSAAAWARYRDGDYKGALKASRRARRLGTRDAKLLFQAGMISYKAGEIEQARRLLRQALDINPEFHPVYAKEARAALRMAEREPKRRARMQSLLLLGALPLVGALGYILALRRMRTGATRGRS